MKIVKLLTNRSEYDIRDAADYSMTVAELIRELEQYDEDEKVVFSNDNGYTYGYVTYDVVEEETVESREEEEYNEKMDDVYNELYDLDYEFENPDDEDEPMTAEEYSQRRQAIFDSYGVTEGEYDAYMNK